MPQTGSFTHELKALSVVLDTLEPLNDEQRNFVLRTAIARLAISGIETDSRSRGDAPATTGQYRGENSTDLSAKEFIKLKNPNSETQRVACLAYYLTHHRGQLHFKTGDITKLNTEAACHKLSNPARTVDNVTKHSGFFAPAGKGNKQLTPYGEDVVKALPDQEAVRAVRDQAGPKRRKGSKNRATKKG